jgi:hypothetical protein
MARTYNAAVSAYPEAGVSPLKVGSTLGEIELPLWRLEFGKPRARIFAGDADAERGVPRALLMTGLLRWAYCDLFIHGMGGANYDRITERWFRQWLGVDLAPSVMITADLRLPLEGADISSADVANARWRAHHVRHDPTMGGDTAAAERKQDLVRRIAGRRERGEHPIEEYRTLQTLLAEYRVHHAAALNAASAEAERAARLLSGRKIASDRTWAFPLYSDEALRSLRAEVERLILAGARTAR